MKSTTGLIYILYNHCTNNKQKYIKLLPLHISFVLYDTIHLIKCKNGTRFLADTLYMLQKNEKKLQKDFALFCPARLHLHYSIFITSASLLQLHYSILTTPSSLFVLLHLFHLFHFACCDKLLHYFIFCFETFLSFYRFLSIHYSSLQYVRC